METKAKKRILISSLVVLALFIMAVVAQGSIINSKHDLSKAGGNIGVCAFCHTPHFANTAAGANGGGAAKPLWNRRLQSFATYSMYNSETLSNHPGAGPSTASLMCLGCHDGINSEGNNSKHTLANVNATRDYDYSGEGFSSANVNCTKCHPAGDANISNSASMGWWIKDLGFGLTGFQKDVALGINLTDDHPVSMNYATSADYVPAASGKVDILPLFSGKVECPSCHDPHNTTIGLFLRKTNSGSALCLTCHIK